MCCAVNSQAGTHSVQQRPDKCFRWISKKVQKSINQAKASDTLIEVFFIFTWKTIPLINNDS